MKKKVFGRKLSRARSTREALFSSLIRSMILSGNIVTTRSKAKAIQPQLEKIVTLARRGGVSARRRILAKLDNKKDAVNFLFQKTITSFGSRSSGFSRIIPLNRRRGDNAPMVKLEWVDKIALEEPKKEEKKGKKKGKQKKESAKTVKTKKATK